VAYRKAGVFVSETKSSTVPVDRYLLSAHVALKMLESRIPTRARAMSSRITSVECQQHVNRFAGSLQLPARLVRPSAGHSLPARHNFITARPASRSTYIPWLAIATFCALQRSAIDVAAAVWPCMRPWWESQAERDREMGQR
jgi:hypothetical protein